MLTAIHPKLPMRDKGVTTRFYCEQLGFKEIGDPHYNYYFMLALDQIEIHFFLSVDLVPEEQDGQVYIRVDDIQKLYQSYQERNISIHPNGALELKPWNQWEFSLLDPDNNVLTFGQAG